jgi:hypothetical protein
MKRRGRPHSSQDLFPEHNMERDAVRTEEMMVTKIQ